MKNKFFENIIFFESIDSTNTELLNKDYPDRTLIYTYNQTAGRGRFERKWQTFKDKALALSILIKKLENFAINKTFYITAILAISCVETITSILKNFTYYIGDNKNNYYNKNIINNYNDSFNKLNLWIKWPNDIYIDDKKVAGILTETKYSNQNNYKIVSGIGININVSKEELSLIQNKSTSLLEEIGSIIDIELFTKLFISQIENNFIKYMEKENSLSYEKIKEKWIEYSKIIGKKVIAQDNNSTQINGFIKGIDEFGNIIIKTDNNDKYKFSDSDIKIIF